MTAVIAPADPGRPMADEQTLRQIGAMNVAAISGGRVLREFKIGWNVAETAALVFPVGRGYRVRVTLAADDTYTVERLFRRSGVDRVKAVRTGVYADEVGEVAYRASCYRDEM